MKDNPLWEAAVNAAAEVIHERRHSTHLYGSEEVAREVLRDALLAVVTKLTDFKYEDEG